MNEDFSKFSKVPKQHPDTSSPFVPPEEINPTTDLAAPHRMHLPPRENEMSDLDADTFVRFMDTGPKPGESHAAYLERIRVYRQGLEEDDDHMDAQYPPSSVH